jgi:hypothetical protein
LEISDDLMPDPVFTATFRIRVDEVFRGSLATGTTLTLAHGGRTRPQLDGRCLMVGARAIELPNHLGARELVTNIAVGCEELPPATLRTLAALPLGWSINDGQLVSPWAAPDDKTHVDAPEPSVPRASYFCGRTGRPAWLTAPGLELRIEKLSKAAPKAGVTDAAEFRIELTNTGRELVTVPALPERAGKALWNESLLIQIGETLFTLGDWRAVLASGGVLAATRLSPGARVSTTVDLWPMLSKVAGPNQGAGNLSVAVFLGDLADETFYYYRRVVHDRPGDPHWNVRPN